MQVAKIYIIKFAWLAIFVFMFYVSLVHIMDFLQNPVCNDQKEEFFVDFCGDQMKIFWNFN